MNVNRQSVEIFEKLLEILVRLEEVLINEGKEH